MFGTLLQPLSYFLINDYRYYYYYKIKKNLYRDKEIIKSYQKMKLKKLIIHAYNYVHFYSSFFKKNGIWPSNIKDLENLKLLPVMTKDDIKCNL